MADISGADKLCGQELFLCIACFRSVGSNFAN